MTLPLSQRMEKNMIYLLLGRRTIKKLVRKTAGKHGSRLVDLIYKLARITLGKREAKKLVKRTLNIIAEVSVLTIHAKMEPHQLQTLRQTLLTLLNKFKEIQIQLRKVEGKWQWEEAVAESKRRFIRSVHRTEKALVNLLTPLCQKETVQRILWVGRCLIDPRILNACFGARSEIVEELLEAAGGMADDQSKRCGSRSRSRRKLRSRASNK